MDIAWLAITVTDTTLEATPLPEAVAVLVIEPASMSARVRAGGGAGDRCAGRQRTSWARNRRLLVIAYTERSSQRGVPAVRNRIGVRDNLSHGVVARRARALDERQARKLLGVRECTGCGLAGLNRDAGAPPGETMQSNGLLLPPLPAEG